MNKQSINKLNLFFMGLKGRFEENEQIFIDIKFEFKAGLKKFNGEGTYVDGEIEYSFNGRIKKMSFNSVLDEILKESNNYDEITLTYRERGANVVITGDNKNVSMKNVEVKEDEVKPKDSKKKSPEGHSESTSTLLKRDYYVKPDKAQALLKEIGIMTQEGKVKNDKIRKYNQIDHYVELLDGVIDKLKDKGTITILDAGCGKSYLSFVLNYYMTEVKKIKCEFIGIDYSEQVIEASKKMASNLGYRNMNFMAMDLNEYKPDKKINIVMSLHACDTATDMALATGVKVNSDVIIAVPCCHRELSTQYDYSPFKNILKHKILKNRLADTLTEGLRANLLEAKGYDVSVIEYISPLETPKNLMIRAYKSKQENPKMLEEYEALIKVLGANPALHKLLNK